MRTTGIVTDSHSSISQSEAEKLGIFVLPMPFYMNGTCYYEGINITREAVSYTHLTLPTIA